MVFVVIRIPVCPLKEIIKLKMMQRILKNQEIDDLLNYYMIAVIDDKLANEFMDKLDYMFNDVDVINFFMHINNMMCLKDCINVLNDKPIDINSIQAYLLSYIYGAMK